MQAKDVMTTDVVAVKPETSVADIAKTLLNRRISAVPIIDDARRILGIVSEGDLMRRPESRSEGHRSWWLAFLTLPEDDARRFVKTHGQHARDVMTRDVVTADEDAPVEQIASILEERHVKRVPIIRDGQLVGIVSRADLLRGLAASRPVSTPSQDDRALRTAVEAAIQQQTGGGAFIGATVTDSVAHLWGGVEEPSDKDAARVAAENVPGIRSVEDRITVFPPDVRAVLWAE